MEFIDNTESYQDENAVGDKEPTGSGGERFLSMMVDEGWKWMLR
jgi:hypothetical protein